MNPLVCVVAEPGFEKLADNLAGELHLGCLPIADEFEAPFQLRFSSEGLFLLERGASHKGISVDFVQGALRHRRLYGGGKNQQIGKAVGLGKGFKPAILDLTAGLGRDAFVLASLGATVRLCERNPIIFSLLREGFTRANQAAIDAPDLSEALGRMSLINMNALQLLDQLGESTLPDVIYLDPMFPPRDKSALVKKEMLVLHTLLGQEVDADELLEPALEKARFRVVVKRPARAPFLADKNPAYSLKGKSTRFDIYSIKKLPTP